MEFSHSLPSHADDATPRHAFTVDVEDYFHVSGFADVIAPSDWGRFEYRVRSNTWRLLELLDQFQVQGTFFVLGWVADRSPELVREIAHAGHEIGCHSYWHRLIYDMRPEEFDEDLRRATGVLQEITGGKVTSYRAPSFSITRDSLWALDVLAKHGYRYDSSIFPTKRQRCGIAEAPLTPHQRETEFGPILEFPLSVCSWAGRRIPIAGGGYFRLFPTAITHWGLQRLERNAGQPFVFYIHPWELDPTQPRIRGARWASRCKHYVNLKRTEPRLRELLSRFSFGKLSECADQSIQSSSQEIIPSLAAPSSVPVRN